METNKILYVKDKMVLNAPVREWCKTEVVDWFYTCNSENLLSSSLTQYQATTLYIKQNINVKRNKEPRS